LHSAILPVQRMEPAIDAGALATLATVCRGPLHVGYCNRDVCAYVTGVRAGVHQQGDKARVVQHQPREVKANPIPYPPPRWKQWTTRTTSCSAALASWTRWGTG
jgi:hypothetical protein